MPRVVLIAFYTLLLSCSAQAQTSIFASSAETDWATSWLETIFRGGAIPEGMAEGTTLLSYLTVALREVLGLYSIGMLVFGGFLLLYHVLAMVAETAHTGTVMGRRTNQLWMPIRFAFALGLLVPIGGGLNSGQYLVVKLAESGSSLASKAWSSVVETTRGHFSSFALPRTPDVVRLASAAVEMELCRSLYHQLFLALQSEPIIQKMGDMEDYSKVPAGRLTKESWRYTNNLQSTLPLCGEYRFESPSSLQEAASSETAKAANDLIEFAHADAERLIVKTRMTTDNLVTSFLNGVAPDTVNISNNLLLLTQEQQQAIKAKLLEVFKTKTPLIDQTLDASSKAGWIAAGLFIPDLVRQQASYGALAARAIPTIQAPLFGHKVLSRQVLDEAIAVNPAARVTAVAQMEKVYSLYDQMAFFMKQVRRWLDSQQSTSVTAAFADQFDLRDQIGATGDSETSFFLFSRLLNAGMFVNGVWAETTSANSSSLTRDMTNNPLTALAEMGRRYLALGTWLFGLTGPALAEPGMITGALLFAGIAFFFCASGFMLVFLWPILPFFRFFLGVLSWILAVFEAIIAIPLVALAHINPVGEGLSGATARQAYWQVLAVFLRPILTLFGFLIGLLILIFAMVFLNNVFLHLTGAMTSLHSETLLSLRVALAFLYAILAFAAVNMSFKGINLLPERALDWLGGFAADTTTVMPATQPAAAAATQGGAGYTVLTAAQQPAGLRGHGSTSSTAISHHSKEEAQGKDASGRGLESALFPMYHETPSQAVMIAAKEELAATLKSESTSGSQSSSSSAVVAGAGGAKAYAQATATASIKNAGKVVPREAENIDFIAEGKTTAPRLPNKKEEAKKESRDQIEVKVEDKSSS